MDSDARGRAAGGERAQTFGSAADDRRAVAAADRARTFVLDTTLPDGAAVRVRAIRPTDKARLQAGFHRLSERSIYQRFFESRKELNASELHYFTEVDFVRHVALVAMLRDDPEPSAIGPGEEEGRMVGVARYISLQPDGPIGPVEIAVTVGDAFQERGIGRLLLRSLIDLARAAGVEEMRGTVLAENHQMLEILQRSGLELVETREHGVVYVALRV